VICAIDLFAKVEYAKEHKKRRALDLLDDFCDFFFENLDSKLIPNLGVQMISGTIILILKYGDIRFFEINEENS